VISRQTGPRDWSPSPSYEEPARRYASRASTTIQCSPLSWRDRSSAWVSLVLGVASVAFALAPQSGDTDGTGRVMFFSLVGIVAIAYGWNALRLAREGRAKAVVAPFLGISFGVVGTVLMLAGLASVYAESAARGEAVALQPFGAPEPQAASDAVEDRAERDSFLESMRTIVGSLSAHGTADGMWPSSLAITTDGATVLLPTGEVLGTLPAGAALTYVPSADSLAYTLVIRGGQHDVIADYSSETDAVTIR